MVKAGHNLQVLMRGNSNISTFLGGPVRVVSLHDGVSIDSTHTKSSHFIRESLDAKIMSFMESSTSMFPTIKLMITKNVRGSATFASVIVLHRKSKEEMKKERQLIRRHTISAKWEACMQKGIRSIFNNKTGWKIKATMRSRNFQLCKMISSCE